MRTKRGISVHRGTPAASQLKRVAFPRLTAERGHTPARTASSHPLSVSCRLSQQLVFCCAMKGDWNSGGGLCLADAQQQSVHSTLVHGASTALNETVDGGPGCRRQDERVTGREGSAVSVPHRKEDAKRERQSQSSVSNTMSLIE